MSRLSRDDYYLSMLRLVDDRSTCGRRSVGAIITTYEGQILATGYNGPPTGLPHCIDTPCAGRYDPPGDTRRCEAVHAEVNAVLQCKRLDLAHTLYVSCTPCFSCAKMICNTPIKRIITLEEYADPHGATLLAKANVVVEVRRVLRNE